MVQVMAGLPPAETPPIAGLPAVLPPELLAPPKLDPAPPPDDVLPELLGGPPALPAFGTTPEPLVPIGLPPLSPSEHDASAPAPLMVVVVRSPKRIKRVMFKVPSRYHRAGARASQIVGKTARGFAPDANLQAQRSQAGFPTWARFHMRAPDAELAHAPHWAAPTPASSA